MFKKKTFIRTKEDFLDLFKRIIPGSITENFSEVPCFEPKGVADKLIHSDNFVKDILFYCNLPQNHTFESYYYAGFVEFTEFLGIWNYGFRSLEAIDRIIKADKERSFAEVVYENGMFADFSEVEIDEWKEHSVRYYREKGEIRTCFTFSSTPWMYEEIQFLLNHCSQTTTAHLVVNMLKHPAKMKIPFHTPTGIKYRRMYTFMILIHLLYDCSKEFIKEIAIPKIREDGFSKKSYNYIVKELSVYERRYIKPTYNEKVDYGKPELKLKWRHNGYRFLLPKNAEMVEKLNNDLYSPENEYLTWAVMNHFIVEVYVKKGKENKFLLELDMDETGEVFTLETITLPKHCSNQKILDKEYELIKSWCSKKNIINS